MQPRNAQRQSDQEDHLYGTKGTWINCPTCFPLLNVGFMTSLRRTDCFVLIWMCNAALAVRRHCHFSKLSRLQIETDKKRERSLFFATCCARKRCLFSCMVGLIQLPESTREICLQGMNPVGGRGRRGTRVLRGSWLKKVSWIEDLNKFKGTRVPKIQGLMGLKG